MQQTLKLEIPEEMYKALRKEAQAKRKTVEQVALDWISEHAPSRKGSMEAIMPFLGSWQMTPEERARIEQKIDEDRHCWM